MELSLLEPFLGVVLNNWFISNPDASGQLKVSKECQRMESTEANGWKLSHNVEVGLGKFEHWPSTQRLTILLHLLHHVDNAIQVKSKLGEVSIETGGDIGEVGDIGDPETIVLHHLDSTLGEMHTSDVGHVQGGSWHQPSRSWEQLRNSSSGQQNEKVELHNKVTSSRMVLIRLRT